MSRIGFAIALILAQLYTASSWAMTYRLFQGFKEESCDNGLHKLQIPIFNTPLVRATQMIYADGPITAGEADRFKEFLKRESCIGPGATVALNSPGGSVVDSIRLGFAIRAAGLRTTIARDSAQQQEPGQCFSACTLAFLGGVQRDPGRAGSVYGVHRFYTENGTLTEGDVQKLSALIVSFVREMGADPDYFTAMVQAGKDEVIALGPDDMARLKITTEEGAIQWQFLPEGGTFVARGVVVDDRGKQQTVEFSCRTEPPSGGRRIVLTFKLDAAFTSVEGVVLEGREESGELIQQVDLTDTVRRSTIPAGHEILSVDTTPQILNLFLQSKKIILSLEDRPTLANYIRLQVVRVEVRIGSDRQQLHDYFESCR